MFPDSPAPAESKLEYKKSRCAIVSVRKSGRVRMHKARENANGSFSIGKTWVLDVLSAIRIYDNFVPSSPLEAQLTERATDEGVTITLGKPYYWQCLSKKERDFFVLSLVKIFTKYTAGRVPLRLEGFDDAKREMFANFKP